jgi:hypothetical protein
MRFCLTALRSALCALLISLMLLLLPRAASAQGLLQGISGLLDFNYSFLSTKTTDSSGLTTKTGVNTYNPRFTLSINTNIFPKLNLNAGGVFEKNISIFKSDVAETTRTTLTRVRPYFFLTLNDPLYTAGIGYSRREETTKTSGTSGVTTVNENYMANLSWKPDGFPSMESQFIRTNTFDEKKIFLDTTTDSFFVTSKYDYRGLDLRYTAAYTDTKNNLNNLEVKDLVQTGWISYSNSFFNRRVSLSTTYNITHDETTTSTSKEGTGEVSLQAFPFAGLSINFDAGMITHLVTLDPNPALIDGNLTASAGINIGVPAPATDNRQRNIGLDFVTPTEVNRLLLWVDRELPLVGIADQFAWDIFISSDNVTWTHVQHLFSAPFGPFQNRFEIKFGNVTARFIKVVTSPLTAAAAALVPTFTNPDRIFITEIQAFLNKPPQVQVKEKTTRTIHIYNLDATARILDIPSLYYNFSYFFDRTDPSGEQTYTFSNALSLNHRFSQVFSGAARVAIENGKQITDETRVAYIYNASLEATPLRTLTDRLTFSGRDETVGKSHTTNNSIFLYNSAQLYKGLDVNLNGGVNFLTNETGQSLTQTTGNFSAGIVPHPTMNLNLAYTYSKTDQSGGGQPSSSTSTHLGDVTLSYNPFRTLYLVAALEVLAEKGQKIRTTQNYVLNWSPFPDGALQFRFSYNESMESAGSGKSRIIGPGVRWYITKRSYLEAFYQMITTESSSGKTDSNLISTNLKLFF